VFIVNLWLNTPTSNPSSRIRVEGRMEPIELRPLSLGELLDRAFTLYRRHFWLFVGIMAIPSVLSIPINSLFFMGQGPFKAGATPPPVFAPGIFLALFGAGIFFMFVYAVAIGAATYAVSESYLGRSATVRASYGRVRGKFWRIIGVVFNVLLRLFGMMLLFGVGVGVVVVGIAAVTAVIKPSGVVAAILAVVAVLAYLTVMSFFVVWSLRYAVSIPALLLENLGVLAAIRRSVELTRGRRKQIFVAVLLTAIVGYIGVIIFQGPFLLATLYSARTGQAPTLPAGLTFASATCGAIGGALTGPLLMIVLVLCYYDTRIRKEAFDLQFMMSSLDRPKAATGTTSPA
jgi:glycerophosphoryl diester phosphodiesterase family protein